MTGKNGYKNSSCRIWNDGICITYLPHREILLAQLVPGYPLQYPPNPKTNNHHRGGSGYICYIWHKGQYWVCYTLIMPANDGQVTGVLKIKGKRAKGMDWYCSSSSKGMGRIDTICFKGYTAYVAVQSVLDWQSHCEDADLQWFFCYRQIWLFNGQEDIIRLSHHLLSFGIAALGWTGARGSVFYCLSARTYTVFCVCDTME